MEATRQPSGASAAKLAGPPADLEAVEERRLLAAFGRGDRGAGEVLVERSYRRIYASLLKLVGGDSELAADLTQDTYRKAWSSLSSFRGGSRFGTWLYRIAYTTFLNHQRGPRRLVPLEDGAAAMLDDPAPGPERSAAAAAQAVRLRQAVMALPDDLRYTVSAHFWGEVAVPDLARSEGITGAAVRKRLKKAMGMLAGRLETLDALEEEVAQ